LMRLLMVLRHLLLVALNNLGYRSGFKRVVVASGRALLCLLTVVR
jgi:hypothetical protein